MHFSVFIFDIFINWEKNLLNSLIVNKKLINLIFDLHIFIFIYNIFNLNQLHEYLIFLKILFVEKEIIF
jgi:hypothetical protein